MYSKVSKKEQNGLFRPIHLTNFMKNSLFYLFFILILKAEAQQADSIRLENATLYYYTYGEGDPIILLSGGPGVASHQEDDLAIALSKKYKAILFDQRGTGKSWTKPFDTTTINIERAVLDVEVLKQHLGIKKLTLTGHSWGAILASAYTAKYPKNVKDLILIGGGELSPDMTAIVNESIEVRYQLSDTTAYYYWMDSVNRQRNPDSAKYEIRKINWSALSYDRSKLDKILEQAQHGVFNLEMNTLMWLSLNANKAKWIEIIQKTYKGKCLLIFGWQDPIAVTTLSSYIKAYPRATVKGINKCGHMPSVEQPEIFYHEIFKHLEAAN
jgi:proline iminopeptidase